MAPVKATQDSGFRIQQFGSRIRRERFMRRVEPHVQGRADRLVGEWVREGDPERPIARLAVTAAGREATPAPDGFPERDRRRAHVRDAPGW